MAASCPFFDLAIYGYMASKASKGLHESIWPSRGSTFTSPAFMQI